MFGKVKAKSSPLSRSISNEMDMEFSPLNALDPSKRKMLSKDVRWYLRKRYLVTVFAFLGITCMSLMRTNLGIALVEMTSTKELISENETRYLAPEFNWSTKEKGILLSAFYYGYIIFCPFAGLLSAKLGGATSLGKSILCNAGLTFITPYCSRLNFYVLIFVRIMEGICQSFTFMSFTELFLYWAPCKERSRLIMITYTGVPFGVAINYSVSSLSAHYLGWEWIFYVSAAISCAWYVAWTLLVTDKPTEDKFITHTEKSYLQQAIYMKKTVTYPWKCILKSIPFWALLNEYFVKSWSYTFIENSLPLYIKDVHDVNIRKIGFIASLPSLCGFVSNFISPAIADWVRSQQIISVSKVHKTFIGIGQLCCVICLMVAGLWSNFEESIICFCVIKISFSFNETSYEVLPIDMFSHFASLIKGLCVSAYGVGSLLNPTIMGCMTLNHTRLEWNNYFIFLTIFNVWGLIIFLFFGSGDLQPWAS